MLQIELNLKKFCIETATRRRYDQLLSTLFQRREAVNEKNEQTVALLKNALVFFDFSALRSRHRELRGKSDARIVLTDNGDHPPAISIDGRPIDMKPCLKK